MADDLRNHAWYGLLQAGLRSLDRVERELEAATGLPVAFCEVLAFLDGRAEGRRMSDLAETLLLSRGGATRLVERMETCGYVARRVPDDDRRATYAVMTDEGRAAYARARPVQHAAVERHFGAAITDEEAEVLRAVSARVLGHLDARCAWLERDAERSASARGR